MGWGVRRTAFFTRIAKPERTIYNNLRKPKKTLTIWDLCHFSDRTPRLYLISSLVFEPKDHYNIALSASADCAKTHIMEDLIMNRTELVDAIAAKADISKKAADDVVKAFIEVVGDELQNGGKVQLVGFGTFETSARAARTGRNPQTGAETKIAACTAPKFKAGKALKDQVNSKK